MNTPLQPDEFFAMMGPDSHHNPVVRAIWLVLEQNGYEIKRKAGWVEPDKMELEKINLEQKIKYEKFQQDLFKVVNFMHPIHNP